ncbi:hypothetical protein ON010_g3513 [Phytophthora cinnamomi]|nr:hypothetical protein ON010_g3513 [Phytophthora cinnamomi]
MTIDELDAAYPDSTGDECDLEHHHHPDDMSSISDLPSPVYVLEDQDELRSWDELEQWEEISVASADWGAGRH